MIAYDSRRCSAEFAKDTALVLCAEGVPAFLFDALRPVPVLSFAVRHLNAAALTYVASFVSAALQLLRLILIARRRNN